MTPQHENEAFVEVSDIFPGSPPGIENNLLNLSLDCTENAKNKQVGSRDHEKEVEESLVDQNSVLNGNDHFEKGPQNFNNDSDIEEIDTSSFKPKSKHVSKFNIFHKYLELELHNRFSNASKFTNFFKTYNPINKTNFALKNVTARELCDAVGIVTLYEAEDKSGDRRLILSTEQPKTFKTMVPVPIPYAGCCSCGVYTLRFAVPFITVTKGVKNISWTNQSKIRDVGKHSSKCGTIRSQKVDYMSIFPNLTRVVRQAF